MSKIDNGNFTPATPASSSSSAGISAGHGVSSRRIAGASQNPFKQRIGEFLGLKKLRRLMSPLQVADADLNPVTSRNGDQMVQDLSRMLVNLERDSAEQSNDKELLKLMIRENIRRILIVEKNKLKSI